MREFIIGKEGNQLFPINGARVSRQHAKITIDDNGRWTLEDLNSTNGTFILDMEGNLHHVKLAPIKEFTKIVLADETVMGCSFYAHHVIEEDPNDYKQEFQHVVRLHDQAMVERAEIEAKIKNRNLLRNMPPMITGLLTVILFFTLPVQQRMSVTIFMGSITAFLATMVNFFLSKDSTLKNFSKKWQKILVCPRCGRPLSDFDFNTQCCPACKAHS